ncbi:hypothetical protein [Sphingosinicella humi]|uniref:Uncharacterized protein n=1 Tax=Allosphingosinicella humi TaxID=2068657 RepID=A0A2U2J5Q5_9SPHN|nr:hypothetical protein [Sphingosinicella humi]PWG03647.1 hypothetical protein DF286_12750 [Sphingosinicella humi]
MEIKRKPTALLLAGAYGVWELFAKPIWNLNVERVAERGNIDDALLGAGRMSDVIASIASYLPSSFGLGFVAGAVIFAYWDNVAAWGRRLRGREARPDMRAWIGNMWPHFDPENRNFELWISLINVGDVPLQLKRLEGTAKIVSMGGTFDLTEPRFHQKLDAFIERAHYATVAVRFDAPAKFWSCLPDMFIWNSPHTSLRLDEFAVVMQSADGTEKIVKGWDSMRLTAGEWEVRSVQTFPLFSSKEEQERFQTAMGNVVKRFGMKL